MEVTKATEIVANNVKGMMETLVVTVKRLEEGQLILQGRVDRLKKNNAELRAALVKMSSSIHPVVDVDVGDDQADQGKAKMVMVPSKSENSLCLDEHAEPVDTPLITETCEQHPLLIPEILQMILRNLDEKSLHGCRLVSKKLNEAAIDVISKQYPQHIELSEKPWWGNRFETPERLSRLHSLLRNSDTPGVLIQGLHCIGSRLMKRECLSIVQKFGWALKMLYIQGCKIKFCTIRSILLEWCPNLEELRLDSLELKAPNSPENIDYQSLELNLKTSKLQRLFISNNYTAKLNTQLCMSIAKLSSNLIFFQIEALGLGDYLSKQLVMLLKDVPEITNRFEELWIIGDFIDEEEKDTIVLSFLDMELGPKLRTLTLQAYHNFKSDDISRLLSKLGSQLDTLNLLMYTSHEEPEPTYEVPWKTAWPKMPMLRVFKCMADDHYHLKSIDFLEYMPNLERFVLVRGYENDKVEYLAPGRVDALFSSSVSSKPHNLKELILIGAINSDFTTTSISHKLPNLTKLFVGLDGDGNEAASQEWFENVFEGFGRMDKLKVLYVDFGNWNLSVKLEVAFEKLVNLKNLRYLIFINGEGVAGSNFVSALKSLLSKADKLQCVRLINFKMLLPDSMSLADWLGKRRTTTRIEFSNKEKMWSSYFA